VRDARCGASNQKERERNANGLPPQNRKGNTHNAHTRRTTPVATYSAGASTSVEPNDLTLPEYCESLFQPPTPRPPASSSPSSPPSPSSSDEPPRCGSLPMRRSSRMSSSASHRPVFGAKGLDTPVCACAHVHNTPQHHGYNGAPLYANHCPLDTTYGRHARAGHLWRWRCRALEGSRGTLSTPPPRTKCLNSP